MDKEQLDILREMAKEYDILAERAIDRKGLDDSYTQHLMRRHLALVHAIVILYQP